MRISDWSSDVCSSDLTPVISPAGLIIYSGDLFPEWKGSALIGGLSSEALVRVAIDGQSAREAERFEMGRRIREVERSEEHTSELQSLMRISYAVFCLKKKTKQQTHII